MIDGYDVEVKLLAITNLVQPLSTSGEASDDAPAQELIEFAGRLCWGTVDKLGSDPKRIQEWIDTGHESVIEHSSATFYIRASRVFTHELVRHRLASYSQRSQRYVSETQQRHVMPPELPEGQGSRVFLDAMNNAWDAYRRLLALGVKKELARYVLPNACETQIVMTMNFRELRHFIRLRTSDRALPEMRAVAGEIRRILKEKAPRVFSDL
jgi:thymidylate synthase (FAD)